MRKNFSVSFTEANKLIVRINTKRCIRKSNYDITDHCDVNLKVITHPFRG